MLVWLWHDYGMPYPPYSPDLTTTDLFLFPKLKTPMKGKPFATTEEIKEKSKQKCFKAWKKRWHRCIKSEGDYCEGGHTG